MLWKRTRDVKWDMGLGRWEMGDGRWDLGSEGGRWWSSGLDGMALELKIEIEAD